MLRTIKPRTARARRALREKEAKLVENAKQALFIPGQTSNKMLHDAMVDLSSLKKPDAKRFDKKNEIRPFEDPTPLEFFSEKNDTSLLVLSTTSKKRKNNLTFVRTFGYKIYDMIELMIAENYRLLADFRAKTFAIGLKPMFAFQGSAFNTHPVYQHIKDLFLDFFRGSVTDLYDVAGLQHVISVTIQGDFEEGESLPNVLFRVYKLKTYRSEQGGRKLPRVELQETGPRFDFKIGRIQSASPEMKKEAHRKPKQLTSKTVKNVETHSTGDKIGKIHMGIQDLSKLQTRKMKGLKSRFNQAEDIQPYLTDEEKELTDEMIEDQTSNNDLDNSEEDTYGEEFVTAEDIEEPVAKKQKKK